MRSGSSGDHTENGSEDIDYVLLARRILSEAGFPLEQIEIRRAAQQRTTAAGQSPSEAGAIDRNQVVTLAREVLADGQPRKAREIAKLLGTRGMAGITRHEVNSILTREGSNEFQYDTQTFTYRLKDTAG